jgi:hypothetical protein
VEACIQLAEISDFQGFRHITVSAKQEMGVQGLVDAITAHAGFHPIYYQLTLNDAVQYVPQNTLERVLMGHHLGLNHKPAITNQNRYCGSS